MRLSDRRWWPVPVLLLGVLLVTGTVKPQRAIPLRASLDESIPLVLAGWHGHDIEISEAEQRVAGMSSFVLRYYTPEREPETARMGGRDFSVYVGYYDQQYQGKTIHSPKNCLPGGGWEPLTSSRERIETPLGVIPVSRYLIGNGRAKSVVLYWYQGRGRVQANEYVVKWDLLRDQALHGRSDEALVRVIVPVTTSEEAAYQQAVRVARELVIGVDRALPPRQLET
jgi:EpsI family protein